MSCVPDPTTPRTPCTACPSGDDVQFLERGNFTLEVTTLLNNNATILQCLADLCGTGGGTETITTLTDNGDGTYTYTSENATATTFCAPGLPLPYAGGYVECTGGALVFIDTSRITNTDMTVGTTPVSVEVTDGVTTAPAVTAALGATFNLDITGLSAANSPWTISQTTTATVCGQTVMQTCTLDILPCV